MELRLLVENIRGFGNGNLVVKSYKQFVVLVPNVGGNQTTVHGVQ
jgi:hypothetical protein